MVNRCREKSSRLLSISASYQAYCYLNESVLKSQRELPLCVSLVFQITFSHQNVITLSHSSQTAGDSLGRSEVFSIFMYFLIYLAFTSVTRLCAYFEFNTIIFFVAISILIIGHWVI